MTPEYGAETQLEKIDMLHHADLVVVNKCDRRGGEDALRAVRKQAQRGEGRQLVGETCSHGSVSTTSLKTFFLHALVESLVGSCALERAVGKFES